MHATISASPFCTARAALETADYGYVLEMGEITHQGPAGALAHDPRVVATYLGGSA